MKTHEEKLSEILSEIRAAREGEYEYFHKKKSFVPSRKEVISIIKNIQALMFPEYFPSGDNSSSGELDMLDKTFFMIKREISASGFLSDCIEFADTESLAYEIIEKIPEIKKSLIKDAQAIYEGDPAASSPEEVILSYPGFYAISIYRIAHEFYERKIPYIPRLMTEYAHEKTGVDIHAGAKIGEYFCIDHGTGIVIGETSTIGNHVKIYQGVTLGAKSFELDENGNPVKGIKRHPDIEDNCVIYANATILGGSTRIGKGAVIGANVWVTSSVDEGKIVYYGKKD
ncbi:MAG: serine acetyltransferase [Clostridia bacterium]|nr:serine acetyltransferase [Clostridia bacterium]